jgi:capsular polysaccharide biosynthesis protein
MPCNLLFIFDRQIICKTVKYIVESDNSSWCVLGFDNLIFSRRIIDWSVENMNLDMTPHGMSLYASVSPKKKDTRIQ